MPGVMPAGLIAEQSTRWIDCMADIHDLRAAVGKGATGQNRRRVGYFAGYRLQACIGG